MIIKRSGDSSALYLTFDDGPDPEFTPRILDLLDFFQVRATFFVLGEACARFPALVRRIHDGGHALGNHTYSHRHPWAISGRDACWEVRQAFEVIADVCGESPRLFRPPYGRRRQCMVEQAEALGMATVLWSRSAIDWGSMAGIGPIGRRLARARAGDIVLCHDGKRENNHPEMTLAVLPGFIDDCRERQLRLVGLDDLLVGARNNGTRRSLSAGQSV